ncbi:MAG: S8 family peptidase [Enhygromyxa sp.]
MIGFELCRWTKAEVAGCPKISLTLLLGAALLVTGCDFGDEVDELGEVDLREGASAETGAVEAEEQPGEALESPPEAGHGPSEIPGHYIVMLKKGANPRAAAAAVRAKPEQVYTRAISGFAGPLNQGQVTALSRRKDVALIEPDQVVSATKQGCLTQIKGSPDYVPAYSVDRIDQLSLPFSNSYTYPDTKAAVKVFVFDTWMYTGHEDFESRAQAGYDGYPNQPSSGQDCSGHGTHVAGIIGGKKYGVAKTAELVSVEVLDCKGKGSWSKLLAGIDWVLANKGNVPAVANMSLRGSKSWIINSAVANLANSGVFVAVAAGNDNADACRYSPASANNVMTTAACNSNDQRASFSNYGSCVDIYAGGTNIVSAWSDGSKRTASGTSMATPHVAGVAALYKQVYGDAPSSQVKAYIASQATPNKISGNPSKTPNLLLHWTCPGL